MANTFFPATSFDKNKITGDALINEVVLVEEIRSTRPDCISLWNNAPRKYATINYPAALAFIIIKSIANTSYLPNCPYKIRFCKTESGYHLKLLDETNAVKKIHYINYIEKSNEIFCGYYKGKERAIYNFSPSTKGGLGIFVLFGLMSLQKDSKFFDNELRQLVDSSSATNDELLQACDNFYSRIVYHEQLQSEFIHSEFYQDVSDICSSPKIIYSSFDDAEVKKPEKTKQSVKDLKDEFGLKISNTRAIPDEVKGYIPSEQLLYTLTMIKCASMRKFMFRGAAGCGKTTDAKMLANILGVPLFTFTCSERTDEMDLISSTIPDGDQFKIVDSPIIEAATMPSVCEIQEPACMNKPGTLPALNNLLDDNKEIRLRDGRIIKMDDNTIYVFTTNVDYRGCRDMNESVLSRMDLIIDYEEPSYIENANRFIEKEGITDDKQKQLVFKAAQVVYEIQRYIEENAISGAVCGFREFSSWCKAAFCTSLNTALKYSILSKISSDKDIQKEVYDNCIVNYLTEED